ncbi:glycosyltransferase [Asaia bogorensis NBRC 16594]|uniref:Glycosyl transferase n=2 Tax=Asaia bogorensis TaxID=91915 RepID=A0AAN4R244_9PROT|nr:glycosyl transferase [Asaia bogorensis NBRC 16594]GBQ75017.1 glycosyltransferase [Asaia bogorensis NBRC 16594]GEL52862.1 glycosyl transferase [Asaia bogorensis NBRC 16594]
MVSVFFDMITPVLDSVERTAWEIICIDDGSQDETLPKLIAAASRDSRIKVIEFSRNFGKEAALTAGIDLAKGDAVIPIDADLQDPPELIIRMVKAWREGSEVVLARRVDRSSDGFLKRKTAAWFYQAHNKLSKTKLPENVGDFRLMDRIVVNALKQLPERQRFMKGLFSWIGFKTITIDYARAERAAGKTKFSGFSLWNFALEGFTSFSTVPLRLWTYLGAVGAVLCLIYAVYIISTTVLFGSPVPGYASIFVSITFFGSIQLISIGLLGEYIGRIYIEVKQRPIYVLKSIHEFDSNM